MRNRHPRGGGGGGGASHLSPGVEMHLCPAAEARGVVVPESFRVTERLQDGVGVKDALLHGVLFKGRGKHTELTLFTAVTH